MLALLAPKKAGHKDGQGKSTASVVILDSMEVFRLEIFRRA